MKFQQFLQDETGNNSVSRLAQVMGIIVTSFAMPYLLIYDTKTFEALFSEYLLYCSGSYAISKLGGIYANKDTTNNTK
jgi:hypothetical protein